MFTFYLPKFYDSILECSIKHNLTLDIFVYIFKALRTKSDWQGDHPDGKDKNKLPVLKFCFKQFSVTNLCKPQRISVVFDETTIGLLKRGFSQSRLLPTYWFLCPKLIWAGELPIIFGLSCPQPSSQAGAHCTPGTPRHQLRFCWFSNINCLFSVLEDKLYFVRISAYLWR